MYLGIEIGGTKLQLGVGADGRQLLEVQRLPVNPDRGAAGVLSQLERAAADLLSRHGAVRGIGVGFGGPVDTDGGRVITSHQIDGWDGVELARWCQEVLGRTAIVGNDCDAAALAEAVYGAGRGRRSLFYVTVGTGVGGGFVLDGQVQGRGRPASAEIGHLRPGLQAERPDMTVESLASGWGIAAAAKARISGDVALPLTRIKDPDSPYLKPSDADDVGQSPHLAVIKPSSPDRAASPSPRRFADCSDVDLEFKHDLLTRVDGDLDQLTAKTVAQAAADGNQLALDVVRHATEVLGWAVAQVVTLLAPEVVVVGGGVALIGESLFLGPLREAAARYVFPPLSQAYEIVPAALGELVVVHGAIALAASRVKD